MESPFYLIIPTLHIGGAEKRFLSLWLFVRKQQKAPVRLVLSESLLEHALRVPELQELARYRKEIHILNWKGGNYFELRKCLGAFYEARKKPAIGFHYVMSFPSFINHAPAKTLFSFTESALKNLNLRAQLLAWLNFIGADYVDILDPKVASQVKKVLKTKADRISQTRNSFVDTSAFQPVPIEEKKNWLVFLGRFIDVKQVIPFAQAIPAMHRLLTENHDLKGLKFFLLGHGAQEEKIRDIVNTASFKDIDIVIGFEPDPVRFLKYAKVFFSLQKNTNYPSKSLLEAMACHNIPLVTDVGTTRKIAHPDFSFYVPEDFTSDDLAKKTGEIFSLPASELEKKMKKARAFVQERFTLEKMAAYYLEIYQKMQNS